jgi:hypothetical protein
MSLVSKLIQAVQSLRRRRSESKSRRRTLIRLEQLDSRQLMAVNFTGNVAADFPVTANSGVYSITDTSPNLVGTVVPAILPPDLQPIVKVSGLDINGISVLYTPSDDTLSIGLLQPLNQKPNASGQQFPVIAGDTDNNGNNGTVDPAVLAAEPNFLNPPNLGGSQTMGAFLDLGGSGNVATDVTNNPQAFITTGYSNDYTDPNVFKTYLVSQAIPSTADPTAVPDFPVDAAHVLSNNIGSHFLGSTDPQHGALEMSIVHFSQVYQQLTGKALTSTSLIQIGAFGNSDDDDGISEGTFPYQPFTLAQATQPPPPTPPTPPTPVPIPPVSPPVQINPHSSRHVNTAHSENVRVTIFSTSGFDATQIDPTTVRLGGATPYTSFKRIFKGNEFAAETFVFRGIDIHLPPGITVATVTGQTFAGTKFSTSELIFNRDDSFYTIDQINGRNAHLGITTTLPTTFNVLDQALISATYKTALAQLEAIQIQAATDAAASAAYQAALAAFDASQGITPAATTTTTSSQVISNALMSQPMQAASTAPLTVSIPTRGQSTTAARSTVPTTAAVSAFSRAAARKSAAATAAAAKSAAAQANLAAHDAAMQSLSTQQQSSSALSSAF